MRTSILLALLMTLAGLPEPLAGQATGTGVLSPGDSVRISVWRSPEMSGDFVVGADGSITHPLYRTVKVAGLPMTTVEANLGRFLAGFQNSPQFVVEPLIRVAVSGEVPRPSVFALRPQTTVAEAVARAGGLNQFGKTRARLVRIDAGGAQREIFFDLRSPGDPIGSGPVHSGDLIVIDRKKSIFREIVLPVVGLVGSVASIVLLIQRNN
ncbi:MAG: polysaccharide biosynthesis/export family protein [Gemmatimonadota bacterium]|nr:polysaccharide biosynthesis/export family protein [Gemmatimonadota bacterium]